MPAAWGTARLVVIESGRLLGRAARTLSGIWPQALGLLLLGWSANHLTILLGVAVSTALAWAVIPVIAVGAVLQLVTILALLRFAALRLGLEVSAEAPAPSGAATGGRGDFTRLVATTLLTFLVLYAAFGYLADYARQVVLLATYREGIGGVLDPLNPLHSTTTAVAMVSTVVLGGLLGRLIEPWAERSRHPVPVKLLGIAVEAVVALTVLLGVFRLFEAAQLWLTDRQVAAWWDEGGAWVRARIRIDLPAVVQQLWAGFVDVVWPVLSTGVLRPLVWLAMAGLVFGGRVLSLADLWRLEPAGAAVTGPLARLRRADETTAGVRRIVLHAQSFLLGGLDERVLPAWQSFRFVLRSGWPFLGAYLISFTLLDVAGEGLEYLLVRLIGGHDVSFWIRVDPFVDLVRTVLVTGLQWVLLAAAYDRALELQAVPVPEPARSPVARWVRAATAAVLGLAVVVAGGLLKPGEVRDVRHVGTNERVELQGTRLIAGDARLARSISTYAQPITTTRVFVVVPFGWASPGTPTGLGLQVTLVSGGRTYAPFDQGSLLSAAPSGFSLVRELVFELDPDDVTPGAALRIAPSELVSGTQQEAEIALGLDGSAVAAAAEVTDVIDIDQKQALR